MFRKTTVHVPEDYEDRLTQMFPGTFQPLRLLALDPCDLPLSKLERNIERDRDDVLHLARTSPLTWKFLEIDRPAGDPAVADQRLQARLPLGIDPIGQILSAVLVVVCGPFLTLLI